MDSVKIVADSGCDLPADLVARYDITIVPVLVRFGQEVISDDKLTSDQFWERVKQTAQAPATSSPAPISFQKVFQRLVEAGHDVVCLTLPSKYSGTFNAAWLAAQEFGERVRVVDTGSFSLGMGLQVLQAAREALAGRGAEFIEKMIENLRTRTSIIFVLDTLEWVRRGGRLAGIMPLIERVARALQVKPVIEMCNGEFRLVAITRSPRAALQRLEEEIRARVPVEAAAAAYTRGREIAAEFVAHLATILNLPARDILVTEAGPAFAAHAGPNALGAVVIRRQ